MRASPDSIPEPETPFDEPSQPAVRSRGILNEITGQTRNPRYRDQKYIDLFREPPSRGD